MQVGGAHVFWGDAVILTDEADVVRMYVFTKLQDGESRLLPCLSADEIINSEHEDLAEPNLSAQRFLAVGPGYPVMQRASNLKNAQIEPCTFMPWNNFIFDRQNRQVCSRVFQPDMAYVVACASFVYGRAWLFY